jgi:hypothetical protein
MRHTLDGFGAAIGGQVLWQPLDAVGLLPAVQQNGQARWLDIGATSDLAPAEHARPRAAGLVSQLVTREPNPSCRWSLTQIKAKEPIE